MTKVRRLSGFQHTFTFSSQTEQFDVFYARFLESDLGKIYIAVPWDELVTAFKLGYPKKGPRSIFSTKGKLALMFLKNYSGFSDRKLMEQLNGNLDWQFFCDIYLGADRPGISRLSARSAASWPGNWTLTRYNRHFTGIGPHTWRTRDPLPWTPPATRAISGTPQA